MLKLGLLLLGMGAVLAIRAGLGALSGGRDPGPPADFAQDHEQLWARTGPKLAVLFTTAGLCVLAAAGVRAVI